jgi:hypothetical protein
MKGGVAPEIEDDRGAALIAEVDRDVMLLWISRERDVGASRGLPKWKTKCRCELVNEAQPPGVGCVVASGAPEQPAGILDPLRGSARGERKLRWCHA